MHPLLLQFGPIALPAYGVFAAIGVLAGLFLSTWLARKLGVNADQVWNLGVVVVFSALVGSRLLLVLMNWRDFRSAPLWMAGLAASHTPSIVLAGGALAMVAGLVYSRIAKLPLLRTLDVLAPATALGHAIASLGAFFGGSGYGTPTALPWGVVYHSRLAAIWTGTPLGVPLHPVQIYKTLVELLIFCLLLVILERCEEGQVMGTWLGLWGVALYFLDLLRGSGHLQMLGGSLTLGQVVAVAMVIGGAMLWWKRDTVEDGAYTL